MKVQIHGKPVAKLAEAFATTATSVLLDEMWPAETDLMLITDEDFSLGHHETIHGELVRIIGFTRGQPRYTVVRGIDSPARSWPASTPVHVAWS